MGLHCRGGWEYNGEQTEGGWREREMHARAHTHVRDT